MTTHATTTGEARATVLGRKPTGKPLRRQNEAITDDQAVRPSNQNKPTAGTEPERAAEDDEDEEEEADDESDEPPTIEESPDLD